MRRAHRKLQLRTHCRACQAGMCTCNATGLTWMEAAGHTLAVLMSGTCTAAARAILGSSAVRALQNEETIAAPQSSYSSAFSLGTLSSYRKQTNDGEGTNALLLSLCLLLRLVLPLLLSQLRIAFASSSNVAHALLALSGLVVSQRMGSSSKPGGLLHWSIMAWTMCVGRHL